MQLGAWLIALAWRHVYTSGLLTRLIVSASDL